MQRNHTMTCHESNTISGEQLFPAHKQYDEKQHSKMGEEKQMQKITVEPQTGKQLGRILFHGGIAYLTYSAAEIGFFYTGERILADIITDEWRMDDRQQGWVGVFVGEDEEPWKRFSFSAAAARVPRRRPPADTGCRTSRMPFPKTSQYARSGFSAAAPPRLLCTAHIPHGRKLNILLPPPPGGSASTVPHLPRQTRRPERGRLCRTAEFAL